MSNIPRNKDTGMKLDDFSKANLGDGDKGGFLNKFNDPRTKERMAYFERDGVCYTATATDKSAYGPLFALCGAGLKKFIATTNYDTPSPGELGALALHGAGFEYYAASYGKNHAIKSKVFKTVSIKVANNLRDTYAVPSSPSALISDIQSETASAKNEQGVYTACGTRTVHRLYLATAYTMLRKLRGSDARDGVVALVVDRGGRIISWGRKNPLVPCWHGETSAIMRLGGRIPAGSAVYSTLKPCKMCAGMIHDASGGDARVFWGQDDPGSLAADTQLDQTRMGRLLDGNKTQDGARAILLQQDGGMAPMATTLGSKFDAQKNTVGGKKSTIDYIMTPEAATIVMQAESYLKAKHTKYGVNAPTNFNENTAFVVRYLMGFLQQLGLQPENLGV